MPAPKAILADIHDLGLDPTIAHTTSNHTGRLKNVNIGVFVKEENKHSKEEKEEKNIVVEDKKQIIQQEILVEEKIIEGAKAPSKKNSKKVN